MFDGGAKQFPHLTRFLQRFLSRRFAPPTEWSAAKIGFIALAVIAVNVALGIGRIEAAAVGLIAVVAGAVFVFGRGSRREPTPEQRFMMEAQAAASVMDQCIQKRRLHRDLDAGSLTLLEECARNWQRVQTTFSSGYWDGEDLPLHYRTAKEQALKAVDSGMAEVVLMYRECLPEVVKGRDAMDFVEEAVEKYVLKEPRNPGFPPPVFDKARKVAEKMRQLATEAEDLARTAETDMPAAGSLPGSALDLSIGELRSIRTAEDELRQNLGG